MMWVAFLAPAVHAATVGAIILTVMWRDMSAWWLLATLIPMAATPEVRTGAAALRRPEDKP